MYLHTLQLNVIVRERERKKEEKTFEYIHVLAKLCRTRIGLFLLDQNFVFQ